MKNRTIGFKQTGRVGRRMLSMFLAAILVFTSMDLPLTAKAADETEGTGGESTKKELSIITSAGSAINGKLYYELEEAAGKLIISGNGEVTREAITYNTLPWYQENWRDKIKSVEIQEGVKGYLGQWFFGNCVNLESIDMSAAGINIIGISAFEGCTKLKEVKFPSAVYYLWSSVFKGCSALETIEIPEAVTTIEKDAFNGCKALKSVTLSEKLGKIQENTFLSCSALEEITIPANVTLIGKNAFNDCTVYTACMLVQCKTAAEGA